MDRKAEILLPEVFIGNYNANAGNSVNRCVRWELMLLRSVTGFSHFGAMVVLAINALCIVH